MEIAGKLIGHDIDHNALLNKMMEKDPKSCRFKVMFYNISNLWVMDSAKLNNLDVLEQFGI